MRRVLVVDDETAITEGLVALFELESIEAHGALDRASAEQIIEREFYPVIIADLRLVTEEDGFTLLESIRRLSPESRVASLTAFATPEVEARLMALGSSVVLRKPMEFDEIIAIVEEMLAELERAADAQQSAGGELDLVQLYADVQKVLHAIPQRRYGLTPDETDELVQEAWCLFLQKRGKILLPRPWLAGTVVNLCRQTIQRNVRTRPVGLDVHDEMGEPATADLANVNDSVLMVRAGLESIDERSRTLCVLIGMEGRSYEEVADMLNLPIGSVGPLYIRSKNKLRKAMGH